MSNFAQRTLTAIIGGALMIGVILLGREFLLILLCFASVVGFYELTGAFGVRSQKSMGLMEAIGITGTLLWYALLELRALSVVPEEKFGLCGLCLIILVFMGHMSVYVLTYPRYDATRTIASFVSFIYCPVMLSFVYMIRSMEMGHVLVWLVFICSWVCDTCAYLVGIKFGRHKMSPKLSPKKSIEGAIGGIAGSVITGCIYGTFLIGPLVSMEKWQLILIMAVICICGSLISMVGDLAASAIKRNHDIKDYGNLLPGHGGIMDRFDSVIFVAPLVYMLCVFL